MLLYLCGTRLITRSLPSRRGINFWPKRWSNVRSASCSSILNLPGPATQVVSRPTYSINTAPLFNVTQEKKNSHAWFQFPGVRFPPCLIVEAHGEGKQERSSVITANIDPGNKFPRCRTAFSASAYTSPILGETLSWKLGKLTFFLNIEILVEP